MGVTVRVKMATATTGGREIWRGSRAAEGLAGHPPVTTRVYACASCACTVSEAVFTTMRLSMTCTCRYRWQCRAVGVG